MANVNDVKTKLVSIELGGKTRNLKFDLNSFAELEEIYGSVEAAMKELQKGSIKSVRVVLWAGLIHDEMILDSTGNPTGKYGITPYQVGSWVSFGDLKDLSKKLQEAMETGLPDPKTSNASENPNV